MIATSATLKIPVRIGPIPILIKSTTKPLRMMRSIKLPTPPAKTNETASTTEKFPGFDNSAKANAPERRKHIPTVNIECRKTSGREAPKLRKPPQLYVS